MTLGGALLSACGLVLFYFSDAQIGQWSTIIPFLAVYGFGRGIEEKKHKYAFINVVTEQMIYLDAIAIQFDHVLKFY